MKEIKLGVQLYTLRDYCQTAEQFEETLKMLNSIGCDVVQISGIGDFEPEVKAELTEKYNMSVCLTHISYDRFFDDYDNLINYLKNCDYEVFGYNILISYLILVVNYIDNKDIKVLLEFMKNILINSIILTLSKESLEVYILQIKKMMKRMLQIVTFFYIIL